MAIEVTNVKLTVDRTVPEGDIVAYVGGTALIENYRDRPNAGEFVTDYVTTFVIATTVTPAPGESTSPEVVLTIGSSTIYTNGVASTIPVAPYIDAQNRTMVPVSAVGRILGAEVDWNEATRTVLVTKDGNRALLTIGSDVMSVNGMNIP
ncbi:copper amine oxidase N-terminal domain-containing protein, partial [Aeromonas veronii]|nr:copper amine oxidase N-terminal domain-containing protein [Aeromonas veronii]